MNTLQQLQKYGQSVWLDNLSREIIENGDLEKRIKQGVLGMTSNPKIFNTAITKGNWYDEKIEEMFRRNKSVESAYETIAIRDVQDACDMLRPVYDETDGVDGYVSLEVSPYLAHDTKGTIEEARRLHGDVDRPNLFIKVPGTEEGIPAIYQLLLDGVNVNITLLFSLHMYEKVIKAYQRAIEDRIARKKEVKSVASVASFFLSRIDVMVDELLDHRIGSSDEKFQNIDLKALRGQAAIANAKLAYQKFQRYFSGESWEKLQNRGARVQRLLWASTSTKNPDFSDVMYVEPLVGKQTVSTLPDETVDAYLDHGEPKPDTVVKDIEDSTKVISQLSQAGIDISFVGRQLVNEGIQKFIDPYKELLDNLKEKKRNILADENTKAHQLL